MPAISSLSQLLLNAIHGTIQRGEIVTSRRFGADDRAISSAGELHLKGPVSDPGIVLMGDFNVDPLQRNAKSI
jgi:hypothetical protein